MNAQDWRKPFEKYFLAGVEKYRAGHHKAAGLLDREGVAFLESIGHTEQEFFDFVEDFSNGGEPTLATALEIASVRRDYFLQEQAGRKSLQMIVSDDLPSKEAAVEGIVWLPRLIAKAKAKLQGEMPPELMYGCGGDRRFFRTNGIDPAEFLRQAWKADGNQATLVEWVKKNRQIEA